MSTETVDQAALRCPGCGVDGKYRDEGFWQCPICALRLDSTPASNEQPAIPAGIPQPNKQQDLQLIAPEDQPAALDVENQRLIDNPTTTTHLDGFTVVQEATNSLTAPNVEATPEFKPDTDAPTNDNTLGPQPFDGFEEPEFQAGDHAGGGRQGDKTLGTLEQSDEGEIVDHSSVDTGETPLVIEPTSAVPSNWPQAADVTDTQDPEPVTVVQPDTFTGGIETPPVGS